MKELGSTLDVFNSHSMFHTTQFPNNEHDLVALPDVYRKHFTNTDGRYFDKSVEASLLGNTVVAPSQRDSSAMPTYYNMRTDSLKTDAAKDVWSVGETGVGCHTGWLSHCQYLIRWMTVPCGDLHVTCA